MRQTIDKFVALAKLYEDYAIRADFPDGFTTLSLPDAYLPVWHQGRELRVYRSLGGVFGDTDPFSLVVDRLDINLFDKSIRFPYEYTEDELSVRYNFAYEFLRKLEANINDVSVFVAEAYEKKKSDEG